MTVFHIWIFFLGIISWKGPSFFTGGGGNFSVQVSYSGGGIYFDGAGSKKFISKKFMG